MALPLLPELTNSGLPLSIPRFVLEGWPVPFTDASVAPGPVFSFSRTPVGGVRLGSRAEDSWRPVLSLGSFSELS